MKEIMLPLTEQDVQSLKAGDRVCLTGTILTGRDAAHKRLAKLVEQGKPLPIDVKGQTLYYVGPAPARLGAPIGAAGPTSSYRMDPFTPMLLDRGLKGMIGKGRRSPEVIDSMKKNHCVYFVAIGGAGALLMKSIEKAEVLCYEDLQSEAIYRFTVKRFPVIVGIDCSGNNLYETEMLKYAVE